MRKSSDGRSDYQRDYRQRKAVEKKAANAPTYCRCGCGAVVVHPKKYTDVCRGIANDRIYAAALERSRIERARIAESLEPLIPTVKRKPPIIMTDAQQHKIDVEAAAKDRERLKLLGYGNGPVTIYRGEEAARVPVTPIHLIPRRDFGVRESGDAFQ